MLPICVWSFDFQFFVIWWLSWSLVHSILFSDPFSCRGIGLAVLSLRGQLTTATSSGFLAKLKSMSSVSFAIFLAAHRVTQAFSIWTDATLFFSLDLCAAKKKMGDISIPARRRSSCWAALPVQRGGWPARCLRPWCWNACIDPWSLPPRWRTCRPPPGGG